MGSLDSFFSFSHTSILCLCIQHTVVPHFSRQQFLIFYLISRINWHSLDQPVYLYHNSRSHLVKLLIIACTLRTNSGCEVKHESVRDFSCL